MWHVFLSFLAALLNVAGSKDFLLDSEYLKNVTIILLSFAEGVLKLHWFLFCFVLVLTLPLLLPLPPPSFIHPKKAEAWAWFSNFESKSVCPIVRVAMVIAIRILAQHWACVTGCQYSAYGAGHATFTHLPSWRALSESFLRLALSCSTLFLAPFAQLA